MKKLTFIAIILLLSIQALSQDKTQDRKTIEVKGWAEKEIIPDEIYFRIALKEYKDGSRKIDINRLEAQLVEAVKKLQIDADNLQAENMYGHNWDWKKKEAGEFLATKSFIIKLENVKQLNDLIGSLDARGVHSSGINEYSHSKMDEYQKELKIEAIQAAKEKAKYLLVAIDEELGRALEIQEIEYGRPQPMYQRAMSYNKESMESDYQSDVAFKTITIRSEIRAVFAIK